MSAERLLKIGERPEVSYLLTERVRELGLGADVDDVMIVRGRHLLRIEDLTFTLRPPPWQGTEPELELMSLRCEPCGGWAYCCKVVHSIEDVGRRVATHRSVHTPEEPA